MSPFVYFFINFKNSLSYLGIIYYNLVIRMKRNYNVKTFVNKQGKQEGLYE